MNSDTKDNLKESGVISRQALGWLRDMKLPADPICYHVAFELFSSPNPELKQRVSQLSENVQERYEGVQQIYQDFIHSKLESNLTQFSKKIDNLASRTIFDMNDTQDSLKAYSGTLEEIQPLITRTSGDTKINVISLLIDETEKIHLKAQTLEEKLLIATEEIKSLQDEHLEFKDKANRDPLTKILNRSGLEQAFELINSEESNYPIAVIIADIDHFKAFNDEHGHLFGDNVLKLVASTLNKFVKRNDILARFGGEEFLLLLPQTSRANGVKVAESLRKKIQSLAIKKKNSDEFLGQITLSLGVSELEFEQQLTEGIDLADQALYQSKHSGRNCVNSK